MDSGGADGDRDNSDSEVRDQCTWESKKVCYCAGVPGGVWPRRRLADRSNYNSNYKRPVVGREKMNKQNNAPDLKGEVDCFDC